MVTRVSAPVTGASGSRGPYLTKGMSEASFVYRHLDAKRHFRDQNVEVKPPGPSVELTTYDLSFTRMLTKRNSLTLSIPYIEGEFNRNFPAGGPGARSISETSGVGDVALTWRKWLLDPDKNPDQNFRLALGAKFPTGDQVQRNPRPINIGTAARPNVVVRNAPADTSIQPGDGGLGLIFGIEAFRRIGERGSAYGEATYLANPRTFNDLNNQEFGSGPYVPNRNTSVPDYFLARSGLAYAQPFHWKGFSSSLGLRIEGQPVRDFIGDDDGFRRPGYSLAVEPGAAYVRGRSAFYVSVPITVYRRRWMSVDEERRGGQPFGRLRAVSAAFADYNVLAGYSRRF